MTALVKNVQPVPANPKTVQPKPEMKMFISKKKYQKIIKKIVERYVDAKDEKKSKNILFLLTNENLTKKNSGYKCSPALFVLASLLKFQQDDYAVNFPP
jgi:hypothetical protein